jgi:hypothetical protein
MRLVWEMFPGNKVNSLVLKVGISPRLCYLAAVRLTNDPSAGNWNVPRDSY